MKTSKKNTEIQEKIPVITLEMMEKTVKDIECPSCRNSTMSYSDDLLFDITFGGKRIVMPNLTGLKCSKCNDVFSPQRAQRTQRIAQHQTSLHPLFSMTCYQHGTTVWHKNDPRSHSMFQQSRIYCTCQRRRDKICLPDCLIR